MTFKIANKEYTGLPVTLAKDDIINIKAGNKVLDLAFEEDYEIIGYTNNIKTGIGKVIFRGIGEYGGVKTVNFKICQRSITEYWQGVKDFMTKIF